MGRFEKTFESSVAYFCAIAVVIGVVGFVVLSVRLWSQFHNSLHDAPECPPQAVKLSDPAELLEKSGNALESLQRANEALARRIKAAIDRQAMEMEMRR